MSQESEAMPQRVEQRDFSTFELGDDVYKLADGIIPEIAEAIAVDIDSIEPHKRLQAMLNGLTTDPNNPDLRASKPIFRKYEVAADYIARSGIQNALARSLWTPETPADEAHVDAIVMQGGVANWMSRTADLITEHHMQRPVHIVPGTRTMNAPGDKVHSKVTSFLDLGKAYPTEQEFARKFTVPELSKAGFVVQLHEYATANGDELYASLVADQPELVQAGVSIAVARVANAGIATALQLRKAARAVNPEFDADPENPQLFVMTDSFPVARRTEEVAMPSKFQSPVTALRQLVVTAKLLHEAEL